ncbi:MAG: hypothetical protein GWP08_18415 [Nitrospiraceae bacterium]|nr:hypothetical protein [Nitrospiraceae bacterium]
MRTAKALARILSILLICVAGPGCPLGGMDDGDDGGNGFPQGGGNNVDPLFQVTYDPASPWNQPIPPDPPLAPNSDAMIALLANRATGGIQLGTHEFSVPVYFADSATPRVEVPLVGPAWERPWVGDDHPIDVILNVPIPVGTRPDPEDDGHCAIIDVSTGYEYDFWRLRWRNGRWTCHWGNRVSYNGNGIYPFGLSARASGFALLAGMVWPAELTAGQIGHKLVGSIPPMACRAGGPVAPATDTDGPSPLANAIPQGAVLQLDPALDLDDPSLGLTPLERSVARALQVYGMVVGDIDGATIEIEGIQDFSFMANPYPGFVTTETVWDGTIFLNNIPVDDLRVLSFGPQFTPVRELEDESIYR